MFEFIPNTVPNTVVVVGAGGTGGRLIPLLAQFLKTMPWVIDPAIIVVDDDIVEEKNLLRQNFIRADVGRHKAVVMAERYSRAFGIEIIPVVKRIQGNYREQREIFANRPSDNGSPIIVMCVDSASARRNILKCFYHLNGGKGTPLYIDSGNEDSFGQVMAFHPRVLYKEPGVDFQGYLAQYEVPPMLPVKVKSPYLYMDLDFYSNLKDNPGGSCADLDQTLAINAMMATSIIGVIQNYYYVKPFTTTRINLVVAQGGSSQMSDLRGVYNLASTFSPENTSVHNAYIRSDSLDSLFSTARNAYRELLEEQRIAAKVLADEANAKAAAEALVQSEVVEQAVLITPEMLERQAIIEAEHEVMNRYIADMAREEIIRRAESTLLEEVSVMVEAGVEANSISMQAVATTGRVAIPSPVIITTS